MIQIITNTSFTQKGVRATNEDYIAPGKPTSQERIYVVCDGMGGHGHGEIASQVVATGLYERLINVPIDLIDERFLQRTVQQVQEEDLNPIHISDNEKKMGTTVILAVIKHDRVIVAHIGDSRLYLMRDGRCKFRTIDHSLVEEGVQAGILTEEEARTHPSKNVLTHCLQPYPEHTPRFEIDILEDIQNGDILLLTTDGVTDALTIVELEQICQVNESSKITEMLLETCSKQSQDNYSGFIIQLSEDETKEEQDTDNSNKQIKGAILRFIKKYGIWAIFILVLITCCVFFCRKNKEKNQSECQTINELTIEQKADQDAPLEAQDK